LGGRALTVQYRTSARRAPGGGGGGGGDGEAATVAVVVVAAAEAVAAVADEIVTEPAGFPQCRCAGFGWFRSARTS